VSDTCTATSARLSTTSEGLWLTATLCNVAQLPPVLKIRPIGSVEATVADHPGIEVLERAGICQAGVVDADVACWVGALGRPDVEIDLVIARPDSFAERLLGPPPLFQAPDDCVEAAEALADWHAQRPPQRVVALCRRDGAWVAAARLWRAGQDDSDDVVVTPLGAGAIGEVVRELLGRARPAGFHGINSEAAALDTVLGAWQADPNIDVVSQLARMGLSVPQARLVEAVADKGTTRAVISAAQYSIDGAVRAPMAVTVADTVVGRVVVGNTVGPDGRRWTALLPGADSAIDSAVAELLESLPSGRDWDSHERIENLDTH
jgi:ESX secretion-associated protein EspG